MYKLRKLLKKIKNNNDDWNIILFLEFIIQKKYKN